MVLIDDDNNNNNNNNGGGGGGCDSLQFFFSTRVLRSSNQPAISEQYSTMKHYLTELLTFVEKYNLRKFFP